MCGRNRCDCARLWLSLARNWDRECRTSSRSGSLPKNADFALFPIPGIGSDGALFAPAASTRIIPDRAMLAGMRQPGHIILGWADKNLKAHCESLSSACTNTNGTTADAAAWPGHRGRHVEGHHREYRYHHPSCQCLSGRTGHDRNAGHPNADDALGARIRVVARNAVQRADAYAAGAKAQTPQIEESMRDSIS